jgi:hypothetical protein
MANTAPTENMLILCQYKLDRFSGEDAMSANETHSHNIYRGLLKKNYGAPSTGTYFGYAQADVPCRRTYILSNLAQLYFSATLTRLVPLLESREQPFTCPFVEKRT